MFTGIIEDIGNVISIKKNGDGLDLTISSKKISKTLRVDNSICVNGVCLTVVVKKTNSFLVQVVNETLLKTNLGSITVGEKVNLERSVRLTDRLSGHLVQGHVDTTGRIEKITTLKGSWLFTISYPKKFRKYLIPVGSISVDGTSLTTARLSTSAFTVAIIPYTFSHTLFHTYKIGSHVNLEFDVLGKYIESLLRVQ